MRVGKYRGILDPQWAQERLEYVEETGELFWKKRPRDDFATERAWKAWNTKHAGTRAFSSIRNSSDDRKARYSGGVTIRRNNKSKPVTLDAHIMCWLVHYGKWPRNEIDHINGNRFDNRIVNLRDATRLEQTQNCARYRNNTSGQTGVSKHNGTGKWIAYIDHNGRRVNLGLFEEFESAVYTRLEAERNFDFHENHGREPLPDINAAVADVTRRRIKTYARKFEEQHEDTGIGKRNRYRLEHQGLDNLELYRLYHAPDAPYKEDNQ